LNDILRRLVMTLGGLMAATAIGAAGYRLIEAWSWVDSFYMAVITLSTVGFGEVWDLSPTGRVFTMLLIVLGVGLVVYLLTVLGEIVVENRLGETLRRERMARRIEGKQGHVIVAGYGRFGRAVVRELRAAGRAVVVVDPDPALGLELERAGIAYVTASASRDEVLLSAGIHGASAIVAATPSDAENVFISLAARELEPGIHIHARSESEAAARKLRRAGADQVTSPFQMGATRTAASILRPAVVDFLELVSPAGEGTAGEAIDLEEVRVGAGSKLAGRSIAEIEEHEERAFRVVALRRSEEEIRIIPNRNTTLVEGDLLVVIGEHDALLAMTREAEPS
jgi:voltage-gated potassium channel